MVTNADIVARLEVLEAERGILQTFGKYAHSVDYALVEDWLDCFTQDGAYEIRRRPGATGVLGRNQGQEGLRKFITTLFQHWRQGPPGGVFQKHVTSTPRITLNGDKAELVSYFFVILELQKAPAIRSFGRYHDKMARCPDGVWRFVERISDVEVMTNAKWPE